MSGMGRREFVALLGGAAAWPVAARAQQQGERVRRIGVVMPHSENDAEFHDYLSAFREGLQKLGWTKHSNRFPLGRAR
jgi:putative ABC transport system substrate-binding protein